MNYKKITLDTERKSFESIVAMQGDNKSRYIEATIVNRSIPVDLTGCTVKFSAIKPDITDIFNDTVISDAKGGKAQIELTNQTLAVPGVIQATLVILKEDMQLSVLPFFITVIENPYNSNAIESKSEYKALNNALTIVEGYAKELQDASVNLEEKYTTRLNNFDSQLVTIETKTGNIEKTINYKNPSYLGVTSHSYFTDDIETHLNKYKSIGCQFELVSFISVNENNSKVMIASCVDKTKQWLNRANELGVNCSLLKIHLVLNDNDGASKGDIVVKIGEELEYFNNYKNELIKYLEICREYGINNFVFANENKNVFNIANYQYYSTIIKSLKTLYADVRFSYSMSGEESRLYLIDNLDSENVLSLCDFISFNMYPSMSNYNILNENETNKTRQKNCYGSGYDIRISNAITKYNKPVFVTEIGCMGRENSLKTPIDTDYENRPSKNNKITGIYFKNAIEVFAKRDNVEGFYIWSAREPFEFFNTTGETVLTEYCKEVYEK